MSLPAPLRLSAPAEQSCEVKKLPLRSERAGGRQISGHAHVRTAHARPELIDRRALALRGRGRNIDKCYCYTREQRRAAGEVLSDGTTTVSVAAETRRSGGNDVRGGGSRRVKGLAVWM